MNKEELIKEIDLMIYKMENTTTKEPVHLNFYFLRDLIERLSDKPQISEEDFDALMFDLEQYCKARIQFGVDKFRMPEFKTKFILEKYLKPQPPKKKCNCKHFAELSEPILYKVGFCEFKAEPIDEQDVGNCEVEPPQTQGDKIRAMSNEELAIILNNTFTKCLYCAHKSKPCKVSDRCEQGILDFLNSEVKDD